MILSKEQVEQRVLYLERQGYDFSIGDIISRSFAIFNAHTKDYVLFTILQIVILGLTGSFGGSLLSYHFLAGYYIYTHKHYTAQVPQFNDFFKGFNFFVKILICIILVGIVTILAFICLVLPAIYFSVAVTLALPIAIFSNSDAWESINFSRRIIHINWWKAFFFIIALALLNVAGVLCLGVGILVTLPVTYIAIYLLFADLLGISELDIHGDTINEIGNDAY